MGPGEVADLLGVTRNAVDQWLHRGVLVPRWRLKGGPLWERRDIVAWARETGRM
jgi:DNA-binding transcriptional MerR regulator